MATRDDGTDAADVVIRLLVGRGDAAGPETVVLVEATSTTELQEALRTFWNLGFVVTSLRMVAEA